MAKDFKVPAGNRLIGQIPYIVCEQVPITDKADGMRTMVSYMLARCQRMIKYDGLPDTIPERDLVLLLQCAGYCGIPDPETTGGKLYALYGGLGGEPNPYYMPTLFTVANPALKLSRNYTVDRDVVIIPHDSMYAGLLPMFRRYATLLVENEITMNMAIINTRMVSLLSASDDTVKAAAEKYLSQIEAGKMGVIGDLSIMEETALKTQPYATHSTGNSLTQLIEMEQYLRASWFNDLGLRANYNMKREAINSNEAQLDSDALLPLIDDILETQTRAFDEVNRRYGTNITLSLASSWEDRQIEEDMETGGGADDETTGGPAEPDNGGDTESNSDR